MIETCKQCQRSGDIGLFRDLSTDVVFCVECLTFGLAAAAGELGLLPPIEVQTQVRDGMKAIADRAAQEGGFGVLVTTFREAQEWAARESVGSVADPAPRYATAGYL